LYVKKYVKKEDAAIIRQWFTQADFLSDVDLFPGWL
jgi:hypothetical protein